MKKIFSVMLLALAFVGVSCSQDKNEIEGGEMAPKFTITAGIENGESRTVLDGLKVLWSGKEEITVASSNTTALFTAEVTEPSATAEFTTTATDFTGAEFLAHYPAAIAANFNIADKCVATVINKVQAPKAGTMDAAAAPMVAYATTTNFSFKNTTALAKFTVAEDNIAIVQLASDDYLAGSFSFNAESMEIVIDASNSQKQILVKPAEGTTFVKGETYYVAILPGEKSNLKLMVNGAVASKEVASFNFKRNTIYNLGEVNYAETPWKVTGDINDWDTMDFTYRFEAVEGQEDVLVAKNVPVPANNGIKITKGFDWSKQLGASSETPAELNKWYAGSSSYNITINGSATSYDIYIYEETQYAIAAAGEAMPALPEGERFSIYAYNKAGWETVNLYTWGGGAYPTGTWPGTQMTETKEINGYIYLVYKLPASATGTSIQMIFNNGSGSQTADSEAITLDKDVYMSVNGGTATLIDDPNNPEVTTTVERSIYVTTTLSWSTMNIYTWSPELKGWPGTAMTKETINGTTWWVLKLGADYDGAKFGGMLFNNGSSQTVDITSGTTLSSDLFFRIETTQSGGKYKVTAVADPRQ
ncbi:MAG: starch-binding protein [Rikenellaceae bacterium]|nr:starch-binding protein [Rikenellaceae bacterium]